MRRDATTYIISHLAHQLGSDLVKDGLQIYLPASLSGGLKVADALGQVLRQGDVGEDLEVLCVEESHAGFALDLP